MYGFLPNDFVPNSAAATPSAPEMGWSVITRIACRDSSSANSRASRSASSSSTSNCRHTVCTTISDNGVLPSAACQIMAAVSLREKKLESVADMIIISPPNIRAAIAELRARYSLPTDRLSRLSDIWKSTCGRNGSIRLQAPASSIRLRPLRLAGVPFCPHARPGNGSPRVLGSANWRTLFQTNVPSTGQSAIRTARPRWDPGARRERRAPCRSPVPPPSG
jgi:hypothetical protein